jgi:hypothetical protein
MFAEKEKLHCILSKQPFFAQNGSKSPVTKMITLTPGLRRRGSLRQLHAEMLSGSGEASGLSFRLPGRVSHQG